MYVCFFYYYKWRQNEHWHVGVLGAADGLALLVAGHIASPAPFA